MKNNIVILIISILFLTSCGSSWIDKPKHLIGKKKMINMLVDIHLANSMQMLKQYPNADSIKLEPEDFYYSVLHKYEVTDTLFEKSLLYYSSFPKDFEKMYSKVLDKTSQIDEEYSGKEIEPVDIGNIRKK